MSGLLAVVVVLAVVLLVTALLSHRAAGRAARSVMHSRAVEAATAARAAVRFLRPGQPGELQQLFDELATPEVGIAVCGPDGQVIAGAGGPAPVRAGDRLSTAVVLAKVRVHGQVREMGQGPQGEHLELWQPMLARGGGAGGGHGWGRGWRWRFEPGKGMERPRFGRRMRLLRVTVARSVADEVVRPSRLTLAVSGTAAGVLVLLALAMYRAARRARQVEQELQRRQALTALGEMAAVLAHEIRTPLGSIKGNVQLIGEDHPDDDRVEVVVREAGRLERLVNGLLDYARPQEPRRTVTDPDEVAERAAQIVAPRAEAAGVPLITDPARCGPCLMADPDQLLQVLVNLLQNAVEASADKGDAGPVVLRIRRRRGQISFAVADSGSGLGDGEVQRLLRPFHSTKQGGTGLGLSVARQITEQHGGSLSLTNRKEGGVLAEVVLPDKGGTLS